MNRKFYGILLLLTLVSAVILFSRTLSIGYLSDDWGYVYLGQHQLLSQAWIYFYTPDAFGNGLGNFRPLISTLTVLIWKIFYTQAWIIHLIAVLLHGLCGFLLGLISFKIFNNKIAAGITAFLFIVLPLNVEAAVWLASWNAPIALTFLLSALILFIDVDKEKYKLPRIILIFILFFLSLTAKEHALLFPAFIIGVDFVLRRKVHFKILFVSIVLEGLYFLWRFQVLGKLGGYVISNGSQLPTNLSFEGVKNFLLLPLFYLHRYFSDVLIPAPLNFVAYLWPLILALSVLIIWWNMGKQNKIYFLKIFFIFVALIYIANIPGWNLVNPLNVLTAHSRILYVSSAWFVLLITWLWVAFNSRILRTIIIIWIFLMIPLNLYQQEPWLVAGKTTKHINQIILDNKDSLRQSEEIRIENLPDNYYGAFIYRNGINYSTALILEKDLSTININKTFQLGIDQKMKLNDREISF